MVWDSFINVKPVKFTLFFLIFTMVTACVAPQVNMVKPLSRDTVMGETQGYVIARVINASGMPLPFNQLTIAPKDLNESDIVKPTRLLSVAKVGGTSSLFLSPVEAGQYSLASVRLFQSNGSYWHDRWVGGKVEMGTFKVVPGKVTDLGTVVYYPKPQEDRYLDMLFRSPSSENAALVAAYAPFFEYDDEESLSWDSDDYEDDRIALYTSVVQNPVVYNKQYQAPDNSIYFVGKLGVFLRRDSLQDWQLDAVDTDSDLQAIAQNQRGDLFIGGDQGALFFKPQGGEWEIQSMGPEYTIEEIVFYKESIVDIVMRSAKEIKISRADLSHSKLSWENISSFTPYRGWEDASGQPYNVGANESTSNSSIKLISAVSTKKMDGMHYFFVTVERGRDFSVFNMRSNYQFSYDPSNWVMKKSSGFDSGIDRVLDAGAIALGIKKAGFWSLDGKDDYYRFEKNNKKWIKISTFVNNCLNQKMVNGLCKADRRTVRGIERFSFVSMPIFSDDLNAVAIIQATKTASNKEPDRKIVTTTDGGKTWKKTDRELPNKYCVRTVPEADDAILVSCYGVSSDFYQSVDGGESWEHVREHENF